MTGRGGETTIGSKFLLAAFLATTLGCASTRLNREQVIEQVGSFIQQIADRGGTKDDYVLQFGIPACTPLTAGEMCEWTKDLGTRMQSSSVPFHNAWTGQTTAITSHGTTYQRFVIIRIVFDEQHQHRQHQVLAQL